MNIQWYTLSHAELFHAFLKVYAKRPGEEGRGETGRVICTLYTQTNCVTAHAHTHTHTHTLPSMVTSCFKSGFWSVAVSTTVLNMRRPVPLLTNRA